MNNNSSYSQALENLGVESVGTTDLLKALLAVQMGATQNGFLSGMGSRPTVLKAGCQVVLDAVDTH